MLVWKGSHGIAVTYEAELVGLKFTCDSSDLGSVCSAGEFGGSPWQSEIALCAGKIGTRSSMVSVPRVDASETRIWRMPAQANVLRQP